MFDETEMNHELSEEQSQVESALRCLDIPVSAIDQDQLMYQAGWAAALAEFGLRKPRPKVTSRVWQTLALSFATTTAACLFLLLNPVSFGDNAVPVTTNVIADLVEPKEDEQFQGQPVVTNSVAEKSEALIRSKRDRLPTMMGIAMNRIVGQRNAQIQRFVAEAASPTKVTFSASQTDWDFDEPVTLTPRSIHSGSL